MGTDESSPDQVIRDRRFWWQLQNIRGLKDFLLSEDAIIPEAEIANIRLGTLDGLSFSSKGRLPTDNERDEIDKRFVGLTKYLTPQLRRKRKIGKLRMYFRTLPFVFLFLTIAALMLDSSTRYLHEGEFMTPLGAFLDLVANMVWIIALGGLGACGYLGTRLMIEARRTPLVPSGEAGGSDAGNELKDIQEIDLTDVNLITTRIVVGILFSFMLGLPVYQYHGYLHKLIVAHAPTDNAELLQDMGLTLLPFILGFSTTLVLNIMERFVSAVGSLFGISSTTK